jgi:hypothetical protein
MSCCGSVVSEEQEYGCYARQSSDDASAHVGCHRTQGAARMVRARMRPPRKALSSHGFWPVRRAFNRRQETPGMRSSEGVVAGSTSIVPARGGGSLLGSTEWVLSLLSFLPGAGNGLWRNWTSTRRRDSGCTLADTLIIPEYLLLRQTPLSLARRSLLARPGHTPSR